jgi:hypothetical protein
VRIEVEERRKTGGKMGFEVGWRLTRTASCNQATQGSASTAAASTTASAQQTLFSQDANFLYICDV